MKEKLLAIKKISNNVNLLFVEDNQGLRQNMEKLLAKVFDQVILAEDGEDGYRKFLKTKPKIVITDINMPKMNGFQLIKKIIASDPECKIIILSAHDEKEHLHLAINFGVFRYLRKPAKLPELIGVIYSSLKSINENENRCLFTNQLNTILNYQNNIVVMMHDDQFIICNDRFYEYFGVENLEIFNEKYDDIDNLLQEHNEFLYSTSTDKWYETLQKNPGKLFHTKIKNHKDEYRHLILKARDIPQKEGHFVLSFDDVTELNLMALFDPDAAKNDLLNKDKEAILSFLKVVQENSSELKIHNIYKGLTIVNPAIIFKINKDSVVLKMPYPQLKVIKLTNYMTISSEIFPKSIMCRSIKNVDIDTQTVTTGTMSFAMNTATDRQHIRLETDDKQKCTFFYKDIRYSGNTSILDISEVSIKLSIDALPAGLDTDTDVKITLNINIHDQLHSITTKANVYRIDKHSNDYHLVLLFELNAQDLHTLKDYIAIRQMELIREFRRLGIE